MTSANDDLKIEANELIQENVVNSIENEENIIEPNVLIVFPEDTFNAAWLAGTKVVRDKGHTWTADLMTKANSSNASDISYAYGSTPSTLISNSLEFKKVLSNVDKSKLSKTKSQRIASWSVFNSGQLQTALQHYNYDLMLYWDVTDSKWRYTGQITDLYDFKYDLSLQAYGNNFGVALGNNVASYGLQMGWLNKFNITVNVSGTF